MKKIVDVIFTNFLNSNDRIYDVMTCNYMIEQYKEQMIQNNVVYGELCHPDNSAVLFTNVSHIINDLWIENGVMMAEIKILNTTNGKILKKNIDNMVFSSRSHGTVDPITKKVSIKKFITIDAIDYKTDAYYQIRVRSRKLKRILK